MTPLQIAKLLNLVAGAAVHMGTSLAALARDQKAAQEAGREYGPADVANAIDRAHEAIEAIGPDDPEAGAMSPTQAAALLNVIAGAARERGTDMTRLSELQALIAGTGRALRPADVKALTGDEHER